MTRLLERYLNETAVAIVGAVLVGCLGMWQVASGYFSHRARVAAFVVYAMAPLSGVAIGRPTSSAIRTTRSTS